MTDPLAAGVPADDAPAQLALFVRKTRTGAAYSTLWRWHLYAGLFVLPFILILSITGSIYLFKPQIERWEERAWLGLGTTAAVSADRQVAAALAARPGARFDHYRLPRKSGDAAMVQLTLVDGRKNQLFVSPQGKVLGELDPGERISDLVAQVHGSLLLGKWGDWLVELAASWTIVMILSGFYLWWPRPMRLAGTLYPRLWLSGRPLLKDIHRVTGFWIGALVLIMLASGLPWAGAWGTAFKWARTELGLVKGPASWKVGAEGSHAGHHGAMHMPGPARPSSDGLPLTVFVHQAEAEHMAFPVLVLPPHAPQRFGPPTGNVWTVKSEAQNRTLDRQVSYDPVTGAEISRRGFDDQHPIDRVVNMGVAWHEGQLFGWPNQLLGLATAVALVSVSVLGLVMWWKRRPGISRSTAEPVDAGAPRWVIGTVVVLGVLLPLFGASLVVIVLIDRLFRRAAYGRGRLSDVSEPRHP